MCDHVLLVQVIFQQATLLYSCSHTWALMKPFAWSMCVLVRSL